VVPVSIEGVRRHFGESSAFHYSIVLIDETGQRIFVFGIERHEALPIVAALHNLPLLRPQTINVMVDTLKLHGLTLEEVHLDHFSVVPPLYHLCSATLLWRNGNGDENVQKLRIRSGDVFGLAQLAGAQLLLSDEVVQQLGSTLPEGQTPELCMIHDLLRREGIVLPEGKKLRLGYSKTPLRDALVKEFKAALLGKAPPFPEEDRAQRKKDLLTFLLQESV
jgi:bifunctional DNase/RNase